MIRSRIIPVLALCTAPAAAQGPASPTSAAVAAFEQICLRKAGSLSAVRSAAVAASFAATGSMPYAGGKSIESYAGPAGLELALRPDRKGFGCMILYPMPSGETADTVAAAVSTLPGLTQTGAGKGSEYRASWTAAAAPAGSKVYLTVHGKMTPPAPILALESKGSSQ